MGTLGIVLFTFLLLCSITACSSYRRHNRNSNGTPDNVVQHRQGNMSRNKIPQLSQLNFLVKPNIDEQLILQQDNQSDRSINSSIVNLSKIPLRRDVSKSVSNINNSNLNSNNSNVNDSNNISNNNLILQQRTSQNNRDIEAFNDQHDKSVTVVIPRAKYHPFVQHMSKNSSKNYLNYLDLDQENTSTQIMPPPNFEQRSKGELPDF